MNYGHSVCRTTHGHAALTRRAALSWTFLVTAVVPAATSAQAGGEPSTDGIRDRNGHPFRTPAGSPLEPVHRIAVLSTNRAGASGTVALADLGDRLGFWIRRDPDGEFELAGALHGGVFSRFDVAGPDQDFIEVHYRAGFLLRARLGAFAARAELYHVSSHLGDEFLVETGTEPISTSREGLEFLLQGSPIRGLTIYGGPGVLLSSSQRLDVLSVRGGADWESSRDPSARFFASADVFSWSELSWEPTISLETGAALGRRVRLGLLLSMGPSRAEQFFRDTETLFGVSVSYVR